ncbi:MAG TPA: hypothetical protein VJJ23_04715 [Candidatus Nanoarchaeia archaeon]|nr:hypothetical protein [Candidatus Nanoarchaeia archaeon]
MTIDDALKNLKITPEERERAKLEEEKKLLEEKLRLEKTEDEVKIEELESKIQVPTGEQIPKYLRSEYRVRDGNQMVLYVGEATNLHYLNKFSIHGNVKLTRYDQIGYIRSRLIVTRIFPLKLEIKKIASVKNKRVWSVEYPISAMFNYHGEPLNFKESSGYKQDLVGTAKIDNLRLSEKLLDEVFRPIDEKIIEMYKQINQ